MRKHANNNKRNVLLFLFCQGKRKWECKKRKKKRKRQCIYRTPVRKGGAAQTLKGKGRITKKKRTFRVQERRRELARLALQNILKKKLCTLAWHSKRVEPAQLQRNTGEKKNAELRSGDKKMRVKKTKRVVKVGDVFHFSAVYAQLKKKKKKENEADNMSDILQGTCCDQGIAGAGYSVDRGTWNCEMQKYKERKKKITSTARTAVKATKPIKA